MTETIKIFDNKTEREITLPEDYRVCIRGELLRAGDKYFSSMDSKWVCTAMINEPTGGGLIYITKEENPVRFVQFKSGISSCCAEVVQTGKKEFKFSSLQKTKI